MKVLLRERRKIYIEGEQGTIATGHPPVLAVSGRVQIAINIIHKIIRTIIRDHHFKSGTMQGYQCFCT